MEPSPAKPKPYANIEDKNMKVDSEMIKDHKLDQDDVKAKSKSKLQKMDMFERFQYRFPFYHMDVNGFMMHIKQAMKVL